jgi:hypothetical protein
MSYSGRNSRRKRKDWLKNPLQTCRAGADKPLLRIFWFHLVVRDHKQPRKTEIPTTCSSASTEDLLKDLQWVPKPQMLRPLIKKKMVVFADHLHTTSQIL